MAADGSDNDAQNSMRKDMLKRLKEMQMQQRIEQEKKATVKRFMTPEAFERLMNVKVANAELFSQLLDLLIAMARGNRIQGNITEAQLRDLLSKLTFRPESKIEFKHK